MKSPPPKVKQFGYFVSDKTEKGKLGLGKQANKGYLKNRRLAGKIIYANICFNFLLFIYLMCEVFYSIFIAPP